MFKWTIKTNVLTIFLALIGAVSISLLSSQYYFNNSLALKSTSQTFQLISNNISQSINDGNQKVANILNANVENKNLHKKIDFKSKHPAFQDLVQMMSINSGIYAMYFAHKDGSFYELVNMRERETLYSLFKAPKNTRWTEIINLDNTAKYTFYDKNSQYISSYMQEKKYNPLGRPWYRDAISSDSNIITEPYLFTNLHDTGTTYAIELSQEGSVFAIDYTMKKLNDLLSLQTMEDNLEVFLFNKNGNKLASSMYKSKDNTQLTTQNIKATELTEEEKMYIANLPPLVISNEEDWVPFDFQLAGVPMGYSIDLIKLLSKKTGLKITFVNGFSWNEIMNGFKNGDIDIVQSLYKTPRREEMGNFTEPMYSFKNYFITQKDSPKINSIKDLEFKKVGVVKGWVIEELLSTNYPNVELVRFNDVSTSIIALSHNKIDAIVETQETYRYLSNQFYLNNLRLDAWFPEYDNNKVRSIYMMIQKENPLLLSILNKALRSLTAQEKERLNKNWLTENIRNLKSEMVEPALIKTLKKEDEGIIQYQYEDKSYFSMYKPIPNSNLYLGIKVDRDILLKPYYESMTYSLLIAFLLLLFSLPIIVFATNVIIKPIKALIMENEKIKHRKFEMVNKVDTNIYEFIELSSSFVSMSQSIQEYQKSQEELLNSIVKLIAEAIDAKSPYTGGHCARVPEIAQMLVEEASKSTQTAFKNFSLETKDELREFEIGAWLHDCGKVTTPEYVVDKATKLETIYDRIHEIRTRFEVLWRDAQIRYLEAKLNGEDNELSLSKLHQEQEKLLEDFHFVANANIGGEFMSKDDQERIREIANREWQRNFDDSLGLGEVEQLRYDKENAQTLPATEKLLSDKQQHIIKREEFDYESYEKDGFREEVPENLYNYGEIYNLCIDKGTLSPEERYKINEHIVMTIKMLEKIPFPAHMTKIPEYAGTHHETLVGNGYPRQLSKEQLSIPSRIMALADIFEALTASDRPYKKAKTLSESIKILSFLVKDKHIDGDIFKLFLESGLHIEYAQRYLKPEQIDEVDIEQYL